MVPLALLTLHAPLRPLSKPSQNKSPALAQVEPGGIARSGGGTPAMSPARSGGGALARSGIVTPASPPRQASPGAPPALLSCSGSASSGQSSSASGTPSPSRSGVTSSTSIAVVVACG